MRLSVGLKDGEDPKKILTRLGRPDQLEVVSGLTPAIINPISSRVMVDGSTIPMTCPA